MNRKLSFLILSFLVFVLSFYSCKKDEPIVKKLIGTWELNKITFLETNVSYPLDSFRNVFNNVTLTLNSDFSFNEVENIGTFNTGPLINTTLTEFYNSPRHSNARYLVYKYNSALRFNSSNFSIQQDSLVFKVSYNAISSITEQIYSRKFNLKGNNELDIERLDLIIFDKQNGKTITDKLNFSYRRK